MLFNIKYTVLLCFYLFCRICKQYKNSSFKYFYRSVSCTNSPVDKQTFFLDSINLKRFYCRLKGHWLIMLAMIWYQNWWSSFDESINPALFVDMLESFKKLKNLWQIKHWKKNQWWYYWVKSPHGFWVSDLSSSIWSH